MSANDLQRMLSRQTIAPENVADVQSDIQTLQQADVAKRAAARRDEAARRARESQQEDNPAPIVRDPIRDLPPSFPFPFPFPYRSDQDQMPDSPFNPFITSSGGPTPFEMDPKFGMQQPMNIMGQPMQQPQFGMQQPQYGSGGIGSLAPAQQANPQQFGLQQQNMGGLGSPQPTSNVLF